MRGFLLRAWMVCDAHDACVCHLGYSGLHCSQVERGACPLGCSAQGECSPEFARGCRCESNRPVQKAITVNYYVHLLLVLMCCGGKSGGGTRKGKPVKALRSPQLFKRLLARNALASLTCLMRLELRVGAFVSRRYLTAHIALRAIQHSQLAVSLEFHR